MKKKATFKTQQVYIYSTAEYIKVFVVSHNGKSERFGHRRTALAHQRELNRK